jgi:hypothetical protein
MANIYKCEDQVLDLFSCFPAMLVSESASSECYNVVFGSKIHPFFPHDEESVRICVHLRLGGLDLDRAINIFTQNLALPGSFVHGFPPMRIFNVQFFYR